MKPIAVCALALLAGCSDPGPSYVTGFSPPSVQPSYTRFVTPAIKGIAPGSDVEYCQWVAAASDTDQDVLDITGLQSKTGHHAVLYATTEKDFPVGETHVCTEDDMLTISFVGAIGGEGTGGSSAKLPDGLFFRLPKGRALMVNTHWLNATQDTVDGQAVIDVQFAAASDARKIADLFANNGDTFKLTPNGATTDYDVNCVLKQDMQFAMNTNHMHEHGISAYSEIVHPDGSKDMVVLDDTWGGDQQFNPKYHRFGVETPLVAHAGDTYHTHCQWRNDTTAPIGFPREMCAGVGFYFPSQGQIACSDGGWGGR